MPQPAASAIPQRRIARLGWRPDTPDWRDYSHPRAALGTVLHPHFDLRKPPTKKFIPPVYDQGDEGSCTAQLLSFLVDFERSKQLMPFLTPSRQMIYYCERAIEGTVGEDAGAEIRDGIKVVVKIGVCPESMWPYVIDNLTKRPPPECYAEAEKHQTWRYARVPQDLLTIKQVLAAWHRPVGFGFAVYESFESDEVALTGVVPMPEADESLLGGHAVAIIGYDDPSERFILRNSWGTEWGQAGYFTMPYAYVLNENLADDFWAITREE